MFPFRIQRQNNTRIWVENYATEIGTFLATELLTGLAASGPERYGELNRINVELNRIYVELNRINMELNRINAELNRINVELNRINAELNRINVELNRINV